MPLTPANISPLVDDMVFKVFPPLKYLELTKINQKIIAVISGCGYKWDVITIGCVSCQC